MKSLDFLEKIYTGRGKKHLDLIKSSLNYVVVTEN